MRTFGAVPLLVLLLAGMPAGAQPPSGMPSRPVVVELFTSQGCSSCPPADALLREIARDRADVLALAFHVTYWDRLGWPDPYALPAATERQRRYVGISHAGTIYTPQMVVDGTRDVVGSDRAAVAAAIAQTAPVAAASLRVMDVAGHVRIVLGPGEGAGKVLLIGYDTERRTAVPRGENAGRSLVEANIVRGIDAAGSWTGAALDITRPRPAGELLAVIVQGPDGRILAAARAVSSPVSVRAGSG